MVNKKPTKNVLDYDPLAWLGEGDEDTEPADDDKPAVVKKAAKKKSVAKKRVSKNKAVKKSSTLKKKADGQLSKDSANDKPVINEVKLTDNEAVNMKNTDEEQPGYGFFNDEPEMTDANPPADIEEGQGYGFFSDTSEDETMKVDEATGESEVYGFFDTSDNLASSPGVDDDSNIINLGAELTIRSVATVKPLIDESISNGFDVKLAAGELQKIDTAGLQLIYSLSRTLEKTSQAITWESSNSIINDAAALIGMPGLLESSEDEGSFGFF